MNRNIEKRQNTFTLNLIKYCFLANMLLSQKQNLKTNGSEYFWQFGK